MCNIVPFKKEHMEQLLKQNINVGMKDCFPEAMLLGLEETDSFSIIYKEQVMVSGGIATIWPGRGHIWCVFNEDSKHSFLGVFRAIKKLIGVWQERYQRIELSVDLGYWHAVACRRAELLGFKLEVACAEKYLPNGGDCTIFSLVRGG